MNGDRRLDSGKGEWLWVILMVIGGVVGSMMVVYLLFAALWTN